ncbi:Phosphatidylserine decarboxylase [Plasmodiophora brassicae]|uniref:Phosphatidylserine decarboxylase n=1 Tax=Plasmodiophora brassicae TaxID=37360 RepID=A0A0G4IPT7_PLABS|nr:hypothetical protein PBRA_000546 [Plasmodiophora brassicae]SPQ97518.1 unnamed protein product [Plasmodiophora brassicae]
MQSNYYLVTLAVIATLMAFSGAVSIRESVAERNEHRFQKMHRFATTVWATTLLAVCCLLAHASACLAMILNKQRPVSGFAVVFAAHLSIAAFVFSFSGIIGAVALVVLAAVASALTWAFFRPTTFAVVALLLSAVFAVQAVQEWRSAEFDPYLVLDFTNRNQIDEEHMSLTLSKTLALIYAIPTLATRLQLTHLFKYVSGRAGPVYSRRLQTDAEKKVAIYDEFIAPLHVNMSLFERQDYRQYESVNDWFARSIRPEERPFRASPPRARPSNRNLLLMGIGSPADGRILVFPRLGRDARLWLKHEPLAVHDLLGGEQLPERFRSLDFTDGYAAVVRLAPQDYHRVHVPRAARVLHQYLVDGPLLSVSAIAMRSGNGAIYNKRLVTILQTRDWLNRTGTYIVVSIGATAVGSVSSVVSEGDVVAGGDTLHEFRFGGSTTVVLFPNSQLMIWSPRLVDNSRAGVETLVRQGDAIGTTYWFGYPDIPPSP